MKPALRTPLLDVHIWAGLVTGLVLLVVALSGAVLVFRDTLERRMDSGRFIVAPGAARLPADELVARARATHSAGSVESVRFYGDPTAPFLVYFSNKDYVHLNPYTGAVLGTRARYGEGFGWVEGLHKYLTLEPPIGEVVNGTFSLVFAGIVVTGLVLWWPATRRALQAGLTLNPRLSGRPWNLNLHKTLGAYTGLVLLASAVSGVPIALDSLRAWLYPLTGSQKIMPPVVAQPGAEFAGFEAIAREVARLMPAARETYLPLPKRGLVAAYAIAADAPHPNARSYAYFEGAGAQLLRHVPYAQAPRGYRWYYWIMSFHTAAIGGWPLKLLLLVATLAVPLLTWTGAASYLRRKLARKAAVARPAPAASSSAPVPAGR